MSNPQIVGERALNRQGQILISLSGKQRGKLFASAEEWCWRSNEKEALSIPGPTVCKQASLMINIQNWERWILQGFSQKLHWFLFYFFVWGNDCLRQRQSRAACNGSLMVFSLYFHFTWSATSSYKLNVNFCLLLVRIKNDFFLRTRTNRSKKKEICSWSKTHQRHIWNILCACVCTLIWDIDSKTERASLMAHPRVKFLSSPSSSKLAVL